MGSSKGDSGEECGGGQEESECGAPRRRRLRFWRKIRKKKNEEGGSRKEESIKAMPTRRFYDLGGWRNCGDRSEDRKQAIRYAAAVEATNG